MNKQQTAVMWLVKSLTDRMYIHCPEFGHTIIDNLIQQAMQMEREQMRQIWDEGRYSLISDEGPEETTFDQYYQQTYQTDKL